MAFRVEERPGQAGGRTGPVYHLTGDPARAEVWPGHGFNCLRWQVRSAGGEWGDVLYTAPDWEANPVPTRSGHPVLFPFPNRIRGGRFDYRGTTYQLPLNDSTKENAIHGFTPRVPWRVLGTEAGGDFAAITGQFRLSVDAPASREYWPADCGLTLTYRLTANALRVEAVVENFGPGPMPFGLGYHPYFRVPTAPDAAADAMTLWAADTALWETEGGVPTGRKLPLPDEFDFRVGRPVGAVALDNLFGDLAPRPGSVDGQLPLVAVLSHPTSPGSLGIHAESAFRELVLFTPVHRKAVAIEPYTCPTDAVNLAARGVDAGWRELEAGGRFPAVVEYRWETPPV